MNFRKCKKKIPKLERRFEYLLFAIRNKKQAYLVQDKIMRLRMMLKARKHWREFTYISKLVQPKFKQTFSEALREYKKLTPAAFNIQVPKKHIPSYLDFISLTPSPPYSKNQHQE